MTFECVECGIAYTTPAGADRCATADKTAHDVEREYLFDDDADDDDDV